MVTHVYTCPHCQHSARVVRRGFNRCGTQRLLCKDCGKTWTPEGYYMGSPGIGRFIRWRVGGKLFPAERYEKKYHRPDLVRAALNGRAD